MPRFKTRDLVFVLAGGLFLWGAQHHHKLAQLLPRPGTPTSFYNLQTPRLDTARFGEALHVEIKVDWFTELGEQFVWTGMRIAERASSGVAIAGEGLRSPWRGATQPAESPVELRTVVVDPGHGGRDPGATGVEGIREKEVTLRLSLALRSELENRGFRVITTRYGDQTVSLRRRIAIAEQHEGDLFVSLHANSAPQDDLHGIITYYPDKSYARHTERVATLGTEFGTAQPNGDSRSFAQADFSLTSRLSQALASTMHRRAVSGVREHYEELSDLGVRRGPFYVLFLPSMPSVLVEAGFITHREEAARMQSEDYVSLLASALAEGIAAYRDTGDWSRTQTAASLSSQPKPAT